MYGSSVCTVCGLSKYMYWYTTLLLEEEKEEEEADKIGLTLEEKEESGWMG